MVGALHTYSRRSIYIPLLYFIHVYICKAAKAAEIVRYLAPDKFIYAPLRDRIDQCAISHVLVHNRGK
jgi:hypothetical protein